MAQGIAQRVGQGAGLREVRLSLVSLRLSQKGGRGCASFIASGPAVVVLSTYLVLRRTSVGTSLPVLFV